MINWRLALVIILCLIPSHGAESVAQSEPLWYSLSSKKATLVIQIDGLWSGSSVEVMSSGRRLDESKVAYSKGFFNQYLINGGVYSLIVDGWDGRLPIDARDGTLTLVKFAVTDPNSLNIRLEFYAEDVTAKEVPWVDAASGLEHWNLRPAKPTLLTPLSDEIRLLIRPPWPIPPDENDGKKS